MADEILEIVKGLASNKVPAFSGLSRRTIINLKNKRDKIKDEAKDLKEKVLKIMGEIKQGIDILAKSVNGEYCIDIEDVFKHFKIINSEIEKEDKREIVELVCQKDNVKLLEMICQQENKDGGGSTKIDQQYSWKGEFTGYERLIDLLQYVLKRGCSSEIVLCIAEKVYGHTHVIYNGKQYLDDIQVVRIEGKFDYPDSVIEDCLKAAIELGYKNVVLVMLGGDIYHCIRLMKGEKFQEEKKAFDMIKETVAEVMSSWVNCKQDLSKEVKGLLKEGIEIDINKMRKEELINELEYRGIEPSRDERQSKRGLVEKLRENLKGEEVKLRLNKTLVGALISTLFFNHQVKKPFKIEISQPDKSRKEKEINELNKKIDSKSFVKEKVLEKIKLLNSSSHTSNSWFFKEVLAAIVNEDDEGDSPGSKAANSKGFMQNNCGQGGKSYYNAGTGSYLNSQNSPRGVGMLDSKSLNEKLKT
ncbi:uncharacterized protein NPIL_366181 [Nephila pilipes]|uniref:Uncharacterized protein n=1 Tax=Nephila pilipes TaxID=299642 RepID=A0A8X6MP85_NEPPI|nr:uncharacterized protein NPIL_366181 [Nephila pilipes]